LSEPLRGCSPRPRKSPGGSTRKFPTFSLRPSSVHDANGASSASFAAFAAFLSADVMLFFFAFSASKCSYIGRKSHFVRSVMFTLLRYGVCERGVEKGEKEGDVREGAP
jgi:hypothetical protein